MFAIKKFNNYEGKTLDTHLGIASSCKGRFALPPQEDIYHDVYHDIIQNKLGIAERHIPDLPEILIYDVDLVLDKSFVESECNSEAYLESFVRNLVADLNNVIASSTDVRNTECHVCLKRSSDGDMYVSKKKDVKIGLHVYYPHMGLLKDEIVFVFECLVTRYSETIKAEPIYEYLVQKDVVSIIDKSVITTNGLLIYGACKEDGIPYQLYRVFDGNMENITPNYAQHTYLDLALLYSLHKNLWLDQKIRTPLVVQITHSDKPQKAPKTKTKTKEKEKKEKQKISSSEIVQRFKKSEAPNGGENIVRANDNIRDLFSHYRRLVMSLNKKRSENYDDWIRIGICLNNCQSEDVDFFPIWDEFSRQSEKYDPDVLKKAWESFSNKRYCVLHSETLYYLLKKDNLEVFEELCSDYECIREDLKTIPYSMTKIMYDMLKDKIVCVSIKPSTWFYHDGLKWVQDDCNNILFRYIERFVCEIRFIQFTKSLIEEVMFFCRHYFYDSKFWDKLNSRDELLCFENGVYDLDNNMFRSNGFYDDYCLFTTRKDFVAPSECQKMTQLETIMKQILPQDDIREYFLYHLATCLHGLKRESIVIILTGSGANGKSFIMNLMSRVLGDYYKQGNITLLTRKRGTSSNASPELIALKSKRMYVLNETENDDVIYTSILKQLSGGDQIEARDLFKTPITFKPQAKIFFTCNDLPQIPSSDYGTWRRLRVVNFPSKFVDNPVLPNEFKKDVSLDKDLDLYVPAMTNILMSYYRKYQKNSYVISEPEDVIKFTDNYKDINDPIMSFLKDMTTSAEGHESDIRVLYQCFKDWFKSNYDSTQKVMSSAKFKDGLAKKGLFNKQKKVAVDIKLIDD